MGFAIVRQSTCSSRTNGAALIRTGRVTSLLRSSDQPAATSPTKRSPSPDHRKREEMRLAHVIALHRVFALWAHFAVVRSWSSQRSGLGWTTQDMSKCLHYPEAREFVHFGPQHHVQLQTLYYKFKHFSIYNNYVERYSNLLRKKSLLLLFAI